jgi:hypothetical protein
MRSSTAAICEAAAEKIGKIGPWFRIVVRRGTFLVAPGACENGFGYATMRSPDG